MKTWMNGCAVVLAAALSVAAYAEEVKPATDGIVAVGMEEGVPGGIVASVMEITAKVVAIDYEARTAELLMPGGKTTSIQVGPEAVNFDQVKKGDMVDALVTEELMIRMGAPGEEFNDGEVAIAVGAEKGDEPAGMVVDTVQMTAVVAALNGIDRTATLMFEDGTLKTVAVRPDIDLTKHHLGERVVFQVTQMLALSIEKK